MAYEFHVMSAKTILGVKSELDKRAAEGWDLFQSYGLGNDEHVLIFRRPKS